MLLIQYEIKKWGKMRAQTGSTLALPGRHSCFASVLRADLYSEILSTYSLDYEPMKKRKGATANIPIWNGCAWAVLWH